MPHAERVFEAPRAARDPAQRQVARAPQFLPDVDPAQFAPLFDRLAAARVVLLGEAAQGGSEFHRARAAITRRLIERGFSILGLEVNAAEGRVFDAYVCGRGPPPADCARSFDRRWRDAEFLDFLDDLRARNARVEGPKAGVRGLDPGGGPGAPDARMFEAMDAALAERGSEARAVIWAQAAQVADFSASETLGAGAGPSLGHRCREAWGPEAVLIGFGPQCEDADSLTALPRRCDAWLSTDGLAPAAPRS
jgi:erythromycin esterase-like protein